jgi:hypothetical protein
VFLVKAILRPAGLLMEIEVSLTFCLDCPQTTNLLISASCVAEITVVSYCAQP